MSYVLYVLCALPSCLRSMRLLSISCVTSVACHSVVCVAKLSAFYAFYALLKYVLCHPCVAKVCVLRVVCMACVRAQATVPVSHRSFELSINDIQNKICRSEVVSGFRSLR